MQPCPTCGGMGIDVNGYCTQCRTYRGVPQTPPPPPTSGVPYSGAPYSGPPNAGYPTSGYPGGGPSFPDQVSAPPFPPTTYGGPYGATAAPQAPKRNGFMVPLLALSGVLVVLVIAIVVVVVVKNGGEDDPAGPGVNANGSQSAKDLVDKCVVGTWETTTYKENVAMDGVGDVLFTQEKNGAVVKFDKDGKGSQTFTGTTFTANMPIEGKSYKVNLEVNATVKYDFRTNDGAMSFSNIENSGKGVVSVPSINFRQEDDWEGNDDPSKYTCDGDTMKMSTSRYTADMKRS